MKTRGIRYLPVLAVSVGLTIGCLLVDLPVAFLASGIVASLLTIMLIVNDVIKG